MTTDLGLLTAAADKWESMAGEIKKVEDRYGDTVQKITMDQNWTGISASVAHTNFAATRYEYSAAQIQAKAIAGLLRDAHGQFTDLKNRLETARENAIAAGMIVSEQGNVAFDYAKLTPSQRSAYQHDPDGKAEVQKAVTKWQQHLDDCVKAVSEADQGVKIALDAVGVDSNKDAFGKGNDETYNGFNVDAQNDIEVYEARNAEDIATRINSGDKVSAADYAELNRSFRDNSSRTEFTQTFLNGMGAQNTLQFTNKLNDLAYQDDKKGKQTYLDLQKGLANSLSNAMQDPKSKFYKDFREQLKTAGVEKFNLKEAAEGPNIISRGHGQQVRGYQSLITLMQNGDGYSAPFMHDLADDIRSAEDKKRGGDPNIWDLQGDFSGKNGGWFANDPLDGLLGIMSKDPAVATSYLDPGADHKNDNLQYLLKERDWKFNDTPVWHGNIETHNDTESEGTDARTGLGLLLESSTTGHTPLGPNQDPWPATPHTEGQARIMHDVISGLGPDQKVHENMREPLAHALATYTADTHEILGGLDSKYISAAGAGYFQDGDKTHMAVSQKDLVQFMRGLSEDPEAYGTLHKAESRYIDLSLEQIPKGAQGSELTNPINKAGTALGVMSSIREDVINDGRMAGYSEADWKAKLAYHVIGGAVTPMYFTTAGGVSIAFGDSIQRGVDTWAWEWGNRMKGEVDAKANPQIADEYLSVNTQAPILIREWANDRADISESDIQDYTRDVLEGRVRGTETAQKYLTDTTN
ncbi:hypothetical protein [Streptomyces atratus]|uniref:hypothetical protein n=2 Tax=Streptomyces atratus TaxID=1893 RepID=UPI002AC34F4B|nr:hypothetical protein [Streptomyces atratus]WPW29172.1 hypothetical protein P6B95_18485 [Streptomyces atratus]